MMKGRAWKFGDNITTDHIIPGRYYHLRSNPDLLAQHLMEDTDPEFASKVQPGDFIVAGRNFGMGSSREHAPLVIKLNDISAVLAKSFARIFYRNAINVGLPLVIVDTSDIETGDQLEVDLKKGIVRVLNKDIELKATPLPEVMLRILDDGGLVNHIRKYGDFKLEG
jgi:3-isopropylmalate/(R)-2-methylmalate dehydratase small subunit